MTFVELLHCVVVKYHHARNFRFAATLARNFTAAPLACGQIVTTLPDSGRANCGIANFITRGRHADFRRRSFPCVESQRYVCALRSIRRNPMRFAIRSDVANNRLLLSCAECKAPVDAEYIGVFRKVGPMIEVWCRMCGRRDSVELVGWRGLPMGTVR